MMKFGEIHPFVRYVQLLHIQPGDYPVLTRSYDCRLFYVYRGEGRIYIENQVYEVTPSSLVLWQGGVRYRMDSYGRTELQFLCVNFDLTQSHKHLDYPIPPARHDLFQFESQVPNLRFSDAVALNRPIFIKSIKAVEDRLLEMKGEYATQHIHWREKINHLMACVLNDLLRKTVSTKQKDNQFFIQFSPVIKYIQENYMKPINNSMLGEMFHYHPNYLNRCMILATGKTLHQYLISCRIQKAIDLLVTTSKSVASIAKETGFNDTSHFSRLFKQITGSNPSQYRRPK